MERTLSEIAVDEFNNLYILIREVTAHTEPGFAEAYSQAQKIVESHMLFYNAQRHVQSDGLPSHGSSLLNGQNSMLTDALMRLGEKATEAQLAAKSEDDQPLREYLVSLGEAMQQSKEHTQAGLKLQELSLII